MRARTVPTARRLAILLSCPVLVGFCVAFVDRPAASLAHADFAARRRLFDALTHIVDPIPPLAGLGLAAAALTALFGWRPGPRVRVFLACCLAVVLASPKLLEVPCATVDELRLVNTLCHAHAWSGCPHSASP